MPIRRVIPVCQWTWWIWIAYLSFPFLDGPFNILHQNFIALFCCLVGWQICIPTWTWDSKANSAFSIVQIGDAQLYTAAQHSTGQAEQDGEENTLLSGNWPAWGTPSIIRQTDCQTIVGNAVKHFVLLSCAQGLWFIIIRKAQQKENL